MKIDIRRVPEEGLTEQVSYEPSTLDMERDDIKAREPFEVEAMINKAGTELVVNVAIRCPLQLTCARCLAEFSMTLTPRGVLSYAMANRQVVDITEDVRQEIMLAYPMTPMCTPDCKGLCQSCGQNLNQGTCSHHATSSPPGAVH